LWNWIILLLLEAILTTLLRKWAHLTPGMNLQIKKFFKRSGNKGTSSAFRDYQFIFLLP
jgi:hypothetical protein